jgi:hypothetical protein
MHGSMYRYAKRYIDISLVQCYREKKFIDWVDFTELNISISSTKTTICFFNIDRTPQITMMAWLLYFVADHADAWRR